MSNSVALFFYMTFLSQFRTDIARTEYLSNADERLRWQANSLPADDLCTENAIMLKRFNRLVYMSLASLYNMNEQSVPRSLMQVTEL